MKRICIVVATLVFFVVAGLSPTFAYEEIKVINGGSIVGKVKFAGTPPKPKKIKITKDTKVCGNTKISPRLIVGKDGGIKNAVVFIEKIDKGKSLKDIPQGPSLDQKGCEFAPHLLIMKVRSPLKIKNSDPVLHNIKMVSRKNPPVNKGQKAHTTMDIKTIKKPDIIKVNCNVHKWMSAWIVAVDHPYYTLTDEKGNFTIDNIPPGKYKLKVWHERLGKRVQDVVIKAKGKTRVSFDLKLKKRRRRR